MAMYHHIVQVCVALLAGCYINMAVAGVSGDCPELTPPENGHLEYETTEGSFASFTCNDGFKLSGGSNLIWCIGGAWSDDPPVCNIIDCGTPTQETGVVADYTNTTYLFTVNYTCSEGYSYANGSFTSTCQQSGDWDGTPMVCTINDCGGLDTPVDGSLSSDGTVYGSTANFTCDLGYDMTGEATITCQANSTWTATEPLCSIADCGELLDPINGTVTFTTTTYGSAATFNCSHGFDLVGSSSILCLANSTWETEPTCDIYDCGSISAPINGTVNYTDTTYGSVAVFDCDVGFAVDGASSSMCTYGSWNATSPSCTVVDCGTLEAPEFGHVNTDLGTEYGMYATYTCRIGFTIQGQYYRQCQDDGTWSAAPPNCTVDDCGSLSSPDNGTVSTPGGTTYLETANYTCDLGFTLNGTSMRTCQDGAEWSETEPSCTIADCGSLNNPSNGSVSYTTTTYLSTADYSCDTGFYISGNETLLCDAGGTWNASEPTCEMYDCGALSDPVNGSVMWYETYYGYPATYDCDNGYNMTSGDYERWCEEPGIWNGTEPVCEIVDCGAPTAPSNGSVTEQGTTFGMMASYSCDIGYHADGGDSESYCEATGYWNGTLLVCSIDDCGSINNPINGSVSYTTTTYLSTADYSCDTGFYISGNETLLCDAGGTWNASEPTCEMYDCGALSDPVNGSVMWYETYYGYPATYACDNGYNMTSGDYERWCEEPGIWNGTEPVCEIVDCGAPTAPSNGSVTEQGTTFGMMASYSCDIGYHADGGDSESYCEATGSWNGTLLVCSIDDCGNLNNPSNGSVSYTTTTYLSTADYSCDTGFYISGNETLLCDAGGTWNASEPTCQIYDCEAPSYPTNGSVSYFATTYGSMATYGCDEGYNITSGDFVTWCEEPGVWNGTEPFCEVVDCGAPTAPSNGSVTEQGTTFGMMANYSCDIGYHADGGDSESYCEATGSWNGTLLVCSIDDCGTLNNPSNGSVSYTTTTYLSTADYSCDTGFYISGNETLLCDAGGTWNASEPTCQIYDCEAPSYPTNGSVSYCETTYGSMAMYGCDEGYNITSGDFVTWCEEPGVWNGTQPFCEVVDCGAPTAPSNGSVTEQGTTFGMMASYSCDIGYHADGGDSESYCEATGSWNGTLLVCSIDDCGNLNNPSNGSVSYTTTTYLSTADYSCDTGFYISGNETLLCDAGGTWNASEPTCQIYDCGAPSYPTNGSVSYCETTYGSMATYGCDEGYNITSGDFVTWCEEPGVWNGTEPFCEVVDCGAPTAPSNGSVTEQGTTFGMMANYSCDIGYHADGGDSESYCEATGSWNGTLLVCSIDDCGSLNNPSNGSVSFTTTTYLSTADYSCDTGFYISGNETLLCDAGGTWNASEPTCQIYDCEAPSYPTNGSVSYCETTYGSMAMYSCDEGYNITSGDFVTWCEEPGVWNGTQPFCEVVDCGAPTAPSNGSVTEQGTTFGMMANYSCDIGYHADGGDSESYCEATGSWNGTLLVCSIDDCGSLNNPSNGSVSYTTTTYLSTADYSCDTGFYISGNETLLCDAGGTWNASEPTCQIYDCGAPSNPTNGSVSYFATTYGSMATYGCDEGYNITSGDFVTWCEESGVWNGTEPFCEVVDCGAPTAPSNGSVTEQGTTFGMMASYSCDIGYHADGGDSESYCEATGYWNGTLLVCSIDDCGTLNNPSNGSVSYTTTTYLSTADYSCDTGFYISGNETLLCDAGGTWNASEPTCPIYDCGAPSNPTNGSVSYCETTYGSMATYGCDEGYNITSGDFVTWCEEPGVWNGTEPFCEVVDCGAPTAPSNGSVTEQGTTFGMMANYSCDIGYHADGGDSESYCEATGSWNGTLLVCSIDDCGSLNDPSNGSVSYTTTTYLSTADYSCDTGFYISGNETLLCDAGGTWNASEPICQIYDCGALATSLGNGTVVQSGTTYMETSVYVCNAGYMISRTVTNTTVTCMANGTWDDIVPTCIDTVCEDLEHPVDGRVNAPDLGYMGQASFTCDEGYTVIGDYILTCLTEGLWDYTAPTCSIIDCGSLSAPANGSVRISSGNTTYSETATYTCDLGFEINSGNATRHCREDSLWDGVEPTCSRKDCGALNGSLSNGSVLSSGSEYEDFVFYSCSTGYVIEPGLIVRYLVCESTGLWNDTEPSQCVSIDCGDLTHPEDGRVHYVDSNYLTLASYTCDEGYKLAGDYIRECGIYGLWDLTAPTCHIKDCGVPVSTGNCTVSASNTTYGSNAYYAGILGYYISSGDAVLECGPEGDWIGEVPTCAIYDCGTLPDIDNGMVRWSGTEYNDTVDYDCMLGYYITSGNETRTCGDDGAWTGDQAVCEVIDCGQPVPPDHSHVILIGTNTTYNSLAIITCNTGYLKISGDSITRCSDDGNWNGDPINCTIQDCGAPDGIENGYYTGSNTTYQSVIYYHCDTGYNVTSGDTSLECGDTGTWLGQAPSCSLHDCGSLPDITNGRKNVSNGSMYNSTAMYTCDVGFYNAVGDDTTPLVCDTDGWNGTIPFCIIHDCGMPNNVSNAVVEVLNGTEFLQEATYTCNPGYIQTHGNSSLVCGPIGDWLGEEINCSRVDCGLMPEDIENGFGRQFGTLYGDLTVYYCNPGYQPGNGTIHVVMECLHTGNWSHELPTCFKVDCGVLSDPANGTVDLTNGTKFGDIVTYTCNEGFQLEGNTIRQCNSSGDWTDSQPECQIYDCGELSEIDKGEVEYSNTLYGAIAQYSCDEGYYISSGNETRTCADGEWNGIQANCTIHDCGEVTYFPTNIDVNFLNTSAATKFGSVVMFMCRPGSVITGSIETSYTKYCSLDGTWQGEPNIPIPGCTLVDCGILGAPGNGNVDLPQGTGLDAVANYTCSHGYEVIGANNRTCQINGSWSVSAPECALYDCGDPDVPANAEVSVDTTTYNSMARYTCAEGYYVDSGDTVRSCLHGGIWSGTQILCAQRLDCGFRYHDVVFALLFNYMISVTQFLEIKSLLKTYIIHTDMESGATHVGFALLEMENTPDVYYGMTEFTNKSDLMEAIDQIPFINRYNIECVECASKALQAFFMDDLYNEGERSDAPNIAVMITSPTYNETAVNLATQHLADSSIQLRTVVLESGDTTLFNNATCNCGELEAPSHGDVVIDSTYYGGTAMFTCEDSYEMVSGKDTSRCQYGGTWSHTPPTCNLIFGYHNYECGFQHHDVVFGLPVSTLVTEQAFEHMKKLLTTSIYHSRDGVNNTRFGFFVFDDSVWPADVVPMNYYNRRTLMATADKLRYRPFNGQPSLVQALEQFDSMILRWGPEPRPNVPVFAFLIMDTTFNSLGATEMANHLRNEMIHLEIISVGFDDLSVPEAFAFGDDHVFPLDSYEELGIHADIVYDHNNCSCGKLSSLANGFQYNNGHHYQDTYLFWCNAGYDMVGPTRIRCLQGAVWSSPPPQCLSDERDFDCGIAHHDVAFGLPISTLITDEDFEYMKNLLTTVVEHTNMDDGSSRVGVFVYDTQIRSVINLDDFNNRHDLIEAIDQLQYTASSEPAALDAALGQFKTMFENDSNISAPNFAFLIMTPEVTVGSAIDIAEELRNLSIHVEITAVGFSNFTLVEQLTFRPTYNHYMDVPTFFDLGMLLRTTLFRDEECYCGMPDGSNNGMTETTGMYYLDTATFTCDEGFDLVGSEVITCQYGGPWSDEAPMCLPDQHNYDCGFARHDVVFGLPVSPMITDQDFQYMKNLVITTIKRTNIDDGSSRLGVFVYDTQIRSVIKKDDFNNRHDLIEAIDELHYTASSEPAALDAALGQFKTMFENRYRISTDKFGFLIMTPEVNHSLSAIDVADELRELNVYMEIAAVAFNNMSLSLVEELAFRPTENHYILLDSFDTMDKIMETEMCHDPKCDCGELLQPANGSLVLSGTWYLDTAYFSCDDGYQISGSQQLQCQYEGSWNDSPPTCELIDCGMPLTPVNGSMAITGTYLHDTAIFDCDYGFDLVGSSEITCQLGPPPGPHVIWSDDVPECTPYGHYYCGFVHHDILFGLPISPVVTEIYFEYLKSVVIKVLERTNIDEGTSRIGLFVYDTRVRPDTVIKLNDFNNRHDLIEAIDELQYRASSQPAAVDAALQQFKTMFQNDYRLVTDKFAFLFMTPEVSDDSESAIDTANDLRNLNIHLDIAPVGFSNMSFVNQLAYRPSDNHYFRFWSFEFMNDVTNYWYQYPQCQCDDLLWPDNGMVEEMTGQYYMDTARFTCDEGFDLVGSEVITCMYEGTWSDQVPMCIPDEHDIYCGYAHHDIVFGLPMSPMVTSQYFDYMKNLVTTSTERSNMDDGSSRVGMFVFDTQIRSVISLDDFNNRHDLIEAIDGLQYTASSEPAALDAALGQFKAMFENDSSVFAPNKAFLILTPEVTVGSAIDIAEELRNLSIHMDVSAIGLNNETLVNQLAYRPENHHYSLPNFDYFDEAVNYIWYQNDYCECPELDAPDNGAMEMTGIFYLDTATFSCDEGFDLVGSEVLTCMSGWGTWATWSGDTPVCAYDEHDFDCGFAHHDIIVGLPISPMITNQDFQYMMSFIRMAAERTNMDDGSSRVGVFVYDTQIRSVINLDDFNNRHDLIEAIDELQYTASSEPAALDAALGQFKTMFENDNRISTDKLAYLTMTPEVKVGSAIDIAEELKNMSVHLDILAVGFNNLSLGNQLAFRPTENHVFNLMAFEWLTLAEDWYKEPECECSHLPLIANGSMEISGTWYLDTANFSCDSHYQLVGSQQLQCQYGGNWNGSLPHCQLTDCPALDQPVGGHLTLIDDGDASLALYECNAGYYLEGESVRKCEGDRIWRPEQPPQCIIHDCGAMLAPLNGFVNGTGTVYQSTVTFGCVLGYELSEPQESICTDLGMWQPAVPPVCSIIDCGSVSEPTNGTTTYTNLTQYGSVATFTCDVGFSMHGPSQVTCTRTGQWSNTTTTLCNIGDCGAMLAPLNGFVNGTGTVYQSTVTFGCVLGYELSEPQESICTDLGMWQPAVPPVCSIIDCGSVSEPTNGTTTYTNLTQYGSVVTFTCDVGFSMHGPSRVTCTRTGQWSNSTTTLCNIGGCGSISLIDGQVTTTGEMFGSTATFKCNAGYYIDGPTSATCGSDGMWGAKPICIIHDCGNLAAPANGSIFLSSGTLYGDLATLSCTNGYLLTGPTVKRCGETGVWLPQVNTICTIHDCGSLASPTFGSLAYNNGSTTFGSMATYACLAGYDLIGPAVTMCQSNGTWSTSTPTCQMADCGAVPEVEFALWTQETVGTRLGAMAMYECITGYRLEGPATIRCTQTGNWTALPSCTIHDCLSIASPENGNVNTPGGTSYGQNATFTCETGYVLNGEREIVCTATGSWSHPPPTCQLADCGRLDDPLNGTVTVQGTEFGDFATYICDVGHRMIGSPNRLCQSNGTWSGETPTCLIRNCTLLFAPENGNILIPANPTYGSIAEFSCFDGYVLTGDSPVIVCRSDGSWSSEFPSCQLPDNTKAIDVDTSLNYTFPANIDLNDPGTYSQYKSQLENILKEKYGLLDGQIRTIIVRRLKRGSIIVTYTVIMPDTRTAYINFAQASDAIVQGIIGIQLFDQTIFSTLMNISNLPVDTSRALCVAYEHAAGPCAQGYICTVDNNIPSCQPDPNTDCGEVSPIADGSVQTNEGTLYGSTVTYNCNTGFTLTGSNTRTCQPEGNWAPAEPYCLVTDCGVLSAPANGDVFAPGGTTYGQTATYLCSFGYSVIGQSSVVCRADGLWSSDPPTCRQTSCGDLASPEDGSVMLSTDGTLAVYSCNMGYTLEGDITLSCVNTAWIGNVPTCIIVSCGSLAGPENGRVEVTGTVYGATALYSCVSHLYELSGPETRTCQADGTWSGHATQCTQIGCGTLEDILHGSVVLSGTHLGDQATYSCITGYSVQGTSVLVCLATGWSHTPPTCVLTGNCGPLSDPAHGTVSYTNTLIGATATYTCFIGYQLSGVTSRQCLDNNMWSHTPPTCDIIDCGLIASPVGGVVTTTSGTTYGSVATYMCHAGYDLIGPTDVTCLQNGSWSYTSICRIKDCGTLANPTNGLVDLVAGTTFGSHAIYSCNPGYSMQGSSTRTCLETGNWHNSEPTCIIRDCGPLTAPTNGHVDYPLGTTYARTATYTCDTGYDLIGSTSRQCGADGLWTGTAPVCDQINTECGDVIAPLNGDVSTSLDAQGQTIATYSCNTGYELSDAAHATRTCDLDGQWTGQIPTCEIIDCGSLSAPLFGQMTSTSQTTYGHNVTFTCDTGYTLYGTARRTCDVNGDWTGTQPVCRVTDCGMPNSPRNGQVNVLDGTTHTMEAIYSCNDGYSLDLNTGMRVRTCQDTGYWSGHPPLCTSANSDDIALALGLGVGFGGLFILIMIIILAILMYNRRHINRRPIKRTHSTIHYTDTVATPLPLKINTGPSMYVPIHGRVLELEEGPSTDDDRYWKTTEYDNQHPLYYGSELPAVEFYQGNYSSS